MDHLLRGYEVNEPTWFYLSLLLILAVFYRFNRIWSLRNLDLALLLSLAPGLLLVKAAGAVSPLGYVWLFAVTGILWLRLLTDALWTRRPRLEQNLNPAGLAFLLCSALAFQITNIVTKAPHVSTVATVQLADELLKRQDSLATQLEAPAAGPAGRLLAAPVVPLAGGVNLAAARSMAVLAHLAVIVGLIFVGRWHFCDTNLGLAMATLYLLLPCTAYDVSRATHVLPPALIVWAVAMFRRPSVAGVLLGLACGTLFFAWFLVPIWLAFYWKRGAVRFGMALVSVAAVLLACLVLTSADTSSFTRQIIGSIDWMALKFDGGQGMGFWSLYDAAYRIPVFTLFVIMLVMLTIWPVQKNLEHLLAHSATTVVATQFWYPQEGGVYVLWYLPLAIIVMFRPRLNHLSAQPPQATATQPVVLATAAALTTTSAATPAIAPKWSITR
jgi:hypothetical protein